MSDKTILDLLIWLEVGLATGIIILGVALVGDVAGWFTSRKKR